MANDLHSGFLPFHNQAFHVFPDSHMPAVPHPDGGWVVFWANCENWRSRGPTPYFEQQSYYEPFGMMYGGRTWRWGYDNGGKWLVSFERKWQRHCFCFCQSEQSRVVGSKTDNVSFNSLSSDVGASASDGREPRALGCLLPRRGRLLAVPRSWWTGVEDGWCEPLLGL